MPRSRTSGAPTTRKSRGSPAQAVVDPLAPVPPALLDIAEAFRRVVDLVSNGQVALNLIHNPGQRREDQRRTDVTAGTLRQLRRIAKEARTLTANQVEGLLITAGRSPNEIVPGPAASSYSGDIQVAVKFVERMLSLGGLFSAVEAQKGTHGGTIPLPCLATLVDLGSDTSAPSRPAELAESSSPLEPTRAHHLNTVGV